jgi:hypothetical protein
VTIDLFAGLRVSDLQRALAWYERLWGSAPAFFPNATEAVWVLAEHRYVYIEELPQGPGHAMHTVFVDDLDDWIGGISARGIEPTSRQTHQAAMWSACVTPAPVRAALPRATTAARNGAQPMKKAAKQNHTRPADRNDALSSSDRYQPTPSVKGNTAINAGSRDTKKIRPAPTDDRETETRTTTWFRPLHAT